MGCWLSFHPPQVCIYYVLYMCKDTSFLCTEICNGMYQLIWNTVDLNLKNIETWGSNGV